MRRGGRAGRPRWGRCRGTVACGQFAVCTCCFSLSNRLAGGIAPLSQRHPGVACTGFAPRVAAHWCRHRPGGACPGTRGGPRPTYVHIKLWPWPFTWGLPSCHFLGAMFGSVGTSLGLLRVSPPPGVTGAPKNSVTRARQAPRCAWVGGVSRFRGADRDPAQGGVVWV